MFKGTEMQQRMFQSEGRLLGDVALKVATFYIAGDLKWLAKTFGFGIMGIIYRKGSNINFVY